ncbi:MAG: hypothetical protein ABIY51_14245 [Ferruginibacter sp.]
MWVLKIIPLFSGLMVSALLLLAQKPMTVTTMDMKTITGCWQGTLTYLDYTTNKPFSMAADLEISQLREEGKFIFANIYPKEPKANSFNTVVIASDGKMIDGEYVKSKKRNADGSLEIITELTGKDGNDNRAAILRYTYNIGKNIYVHRKDVQFIGQKEWIKRHEYMYHRKACK